MTTDEEIAELKRKVTGLARVAIQITAAISELRVAAYRSAVSGNGMLRKDDQDALQKHFDEVGTRVDKIVALIGEILDPEKTNG